MLTTMHPTLNDHVYNMRPTCVVHVVWHHFIPESSTPFSQVLWSVLWLHHQLVTDVTAWLIKPNPSCSKNRKEKKKKKKNKIKWKEKIKMKSTVNDLDKTVDTIYIYKEVKAIIWDHIIYLWISLQAWFAIQILCLTLWISYLFSDRFPYLI